MSYIIHSNILDINRIHVFHPYIKADNKIIISNNILDINHFKIKHYKKNIEYQT